MGYFDDFVDMGDTQPVKVDDLPELYASISALAGLPPDIAGNAITSALKGEKEQNTATTPMTSALANLQPGTRLADLTGDEGFAIRSLLARNTPNFDVFTRVGENIDPTTNQLPPFDLDPVRERTPFLDTGPEYTGGVLPPSQLAPDGTNRFSAIPNVLSNLDFGIGGSGRFLYPTVGIDDSFTADLPFTQTTTRFRPAQTGEQGAVIGPGGVPGFYEDVVSFTAPATAQPFPFTSEFAPGEFGLGDPMGIARENVNIGLLDLASPEVQRMSDAQKAQRLQAKRGYLGGAMQFGDSIASPTTTQLPIEFIQNPTARGIVTTPDTTTSVAPVDDGTLRTRTRVTDKPKPGDEDSDKPKPVDDDTGAEDIVQNGGAPPFPPRSEATRGDYYVFNNTAYIYHPYYQQNGGWYRVGQTAETSADGRKTPSDIDDSETRELMRTWDSALDQAINNNQMDAEGNKLFSTQQPSAPESPPTFFPRRPYVNYGTPTNLRTATDQFGQPVVQGMGQPMQQIGGQRAVSVVPPATYGEVLGGTPMQPMTTTGGFYDDLYQQSLKPVDAFKAYQLSQFPGASLGSRLAAQDALGTGFDPAFGRFLLGSASGRIAPQEGADASSGFGGYLRNRQRADLSQVRQEFANLGAALRGYTPGGTLDPRFASYYETFGDPSDPSTLRNSVLRAAQAALGTRERTGALGNIYDVMQQQYGTGAGSRFADFVGGAFSQQPMMQSFSPTASINALSTMAKQQPVGGVPNTLFGGTMGY